LEKNDKLRDLVDQRLRGEINFIPCSGYGSDDGTDLRLERAQTELTQIKAENRTLKSQHQTTERLLDDARQKSARLYVCSVYVWP